MHKLVQCFMVFLQRKIGPQSSGEHKLRIGTLPQKKVAQPLFSAGTNDQVHLRQTLCVQAGRKQGFIDLLRLNTTVRSLFGKQLHRTQDLRAAAVIDGDIQLQPGIAAGSFLRLDQYLLLRRRKSTFISQNADTDLLFIQFIDLGLEKFKHQRH